MSLTTQDHPSESNSLAATEDVLSIAIACLPTFSLSVSESENIHAVRRGSAEGAMAHGPMAYDGAHAPIPSLSRLEQPRPSYNQS